ncbi:uncharacterized protein LOC124195407 [Daphnia pulex]|uniref:uncharacterized protein LOC124195407 n=1 Tax=Daphnia pulex TaxID=6669 RepID=UPI001EDD6332|nr:uncharacterized protein LOC124195407 [Daphnia pulex]
MFKLLNVLCSAVEVGPIPISDVNLQKDRPVCFEGHGNHYVQYPQGLGGEGAKKIRIKGERKGYRHQLGEHHRHGNNCCGPPVPIGFFIALPARNNCSQLLLTIMSCCCRISLMAGSSASLPMTFGTDTKPQCRRPTTQQQHTLQPVITPSMLQGITPQLMIPRATTPTP